MRRWAPVMVLVVTASFIGCLDDDEDGIPEPCELSGELPTCSWDEIVGTWVAQDQWRIEVLLNADGTFRKTDFVAPCPEDSECFWSGIVMFSGHWELDEGTVTLTYDEYEDDYLGAGFDVATPETLTVRTCTDSSELSLLDDLGVQYMMSY